MVQLAKALRSEQQRMHMVDHQLARRGVIDSVVLNAMRAIPREAFLPEHLHEFAYEDTPLPIAEGQTISQPYMVALMTEALDLAAEDRVLEIGTGSGYAAAVLGEIAAEVISIERHHALAERAANTLARLGYENVSVLEGDGTRGWQEGAPYDAIIVTAGAPAVPEALMEQLAVGGRLVIPVGPHEHQYLQRMTRSDEDAYTEEVLEPVRFVPLIGAAGWSESGEAQSPQVPAAPPRPTTITQLIAETAEHFEDIEQADLTPLLDRIGNARVVCIGEATHGTSEFYRLRARITRELISRQGFDMVAVEADWPDAARIDHYVRDLQTPPGEWTAFTRFPTWMWRNTEVREFVDWLRTYNADLAPRRRVGFHGLDLYSLYTSIDAILQYLDDVDPEAAQVARERYGCLSPWQRDPAAYGRAALHGRFADCEREVGRMLTDLLRKRMEYAAHDGSRFFDAEQNARLIANAEKYYRAMYRG
ncbi:MAG: protein-L-isoaspartate(D-aspartate) O-methyltransferase, partial [Planctomycetota bacterium]